MCFLERLCFFKVCWPRFRPQEPWTTWRRRSPTLPATTWVQPCSVCWFAWCSLKLKSACLRRLLFQAFKTSSNPWWKWPRRRPRWINGAEDPPWSRLTNLHLAFCRRKKKITPPQFNPLLCWVLKMSLKQLYPRAFLPGLRHLQPGLPVHEPGTNQRPRPVLLVHHVPGQIQPLPRNGTLLCGIGPRGPPA